MRNTLLPGSIFGFVVIWVAQSCAAVDFRWFLEPAMNGTLVAGIENKQGSYLRISCSTEVGPSLEYSPKSVKLAKGDPIQIVVGEGTTFFDVDASGLANLDTRGSRLQLEKLVRNLIETKATTLIVELPKLGSSEVFSTKDAGKSMRFENETLVNPCLGSS